MSSLFQPGPKTAKGGVMKDITGLDLGSQPS
jgi:hypothetical protein